MRRRIDLDDDGSGDSLKDAMRQLQEQLDGRQRTSGEAAEKEPDEERPEPDPDDARRKFEEERKAGYRAAREGVQDALEAIERKQRAAAERRPAERTGVLRWILLGVIVVGAVVAGVITLRPEPPPPVAPTAEAAVEYFWRALIDGKYEAAAAYYPTLVDRYASRKQAAVYLEGLFGGNPPIHITSIGQAEELSESSDLRVAYEVYLRNGRPRTGEFIVRQSEGAMGGYVIVAAP